MKSKNNILLKSIKKNEDFVFVLKQGRKIKNEIFSVWIKNNFSNKQINYGLMVSKEFFKKAVTRNKIKRQIKNMLLNINFKENMSILIKPTINYLNKDFQTNTKKLEELINKNQQNGK